MCTFGEKTETEIHKFHWLSRVSGLIRLAQTHMLIHIQTYIFTHIYADISPNACISLNKSGTKSIPALQQIPYQNTMQQCTTIDTNQYFMMAGSA